MAINILSNCACAFNAIRPFEFVGPGCQGIAGTLESGSNYRVGDLVQYDTSTKSYKPIAVGDTLSAASRIGIIKNLRKFPGNQTYGQINEDGTAISADFKHAVLWMSGSETRFKCSDVFLKNGTARVAFDPATHTSLAAQLKIIASNDFEGTDAVNYFTFR